MCLEVNWHSVEFVLCIYPSKVHTHSSEHTHPEQRADIYAAAPGEQLEVRCLAQVHLVVVLRERWLFTPTQPTHPPTYLPTIPACLRLELATFGLQLQLSNH